MSQTFDICSRSERTSAQTYETFPKGPDRYMGWNETKKYAPEVSLDTLRIFLALVAHNDLHCYQMDVITAFLNGDFVEDI